MFCMLEIEILPESGPLANTNSAYCLSQEWLFLLIISASHSVDTKPENQVFSKSVLSRCFLRILFSDTWLEYFPYSPHHIESVRLRYIKEARYTGTHTHCYHGEEHQHYYFKMISALSKTLYLPRCDNRVAQGRVNVIGL